jgi:molybdopterin synthase catalytic subunit
MIKIKYQTEPININSITDNIATDADGAAVIFIGAVRNYSNGKNVLYLEYEIYNEMAEKELNKITEEAFKHWKITNCEVVHRYGKVKIGETSIVIAVASGHRDESYKASRYIIEEIKKRVPVWKKEFYSDGSNWITKGS